MTVTFCATPAVVADAPATVNVAACAGVTGSTRLFVSAGDDASLTVIDCVPTVSRISENHFTPASAALKVAVAGSTARGSELENATVPA